MQIIIPPRYGSLNYNPKAYLYQAARNLGINHQKREALIERTSLDDEEAVKFADPAPSAERIVYSKQCLVQIHQALSELPERPRRAFEMIHGASGSILVEKQRIERREVFGLTRLNFMIGGFAVLGAGTAFYSLGSDLLLQGRADYERAKGEIRRINLPDGSVATMGPDSAVTLDFSNESRIIHLLVSMSYFDVKRDPNRPFTVLAGSMSATALGTVFDVISDAGVLSVSVDHGLVEVRSSDPALETGV